MHEIVTCANSEDLKNYGKKYDKNQWYITGVISGDGTSIDYIIHSYENVVEPKGNFNDRHICMRKEELDEYINAFIDKKIRKKI